MLSSVVEQVAISIFNIDRQIAGDKRTWDSWPGWVNEATKEEYRCRAIAAMRSLRAIIANMLSEVSKGKSYHSDWDLEKEDFIHDFLNRFDAALPLTVIDD